MPYVLPTPQTRQTGWDYAGQLQGTMSKQAVDALLAAILGQGATIGRTPTAGQYTSPTGQSAFISPAERVASNPSMSAASAIQRSGQGSFLPTQYSGLQLQPNLDRQLKQAQLGQSQASTKYMNSLSQLQPQASAAPSAGVYQPGDILERGGKRYQIVGFDTDGMPLVEEE